MKHWRETSEIVDRVFVLASAGRRAAMATVVRIDGSSYRRPGARFLIEDDGRTIGGVSGGCLEADVCEIGQRVIETGTPRLLHYDTGADDQVIWGLGLGCNGAVDIFVQPATEPRTLDVLSDLQGRLARTTAFAASTILAGPDAGRMSIVDTPPPDGQSRVTREGAQTIFTEAFQPPPPLMVCGAGDDARPLVAYASEAGFAVTVVDQRQAFLRADRFPSARRRVLWTPD